jgi:hypothetical protein
MTIVEKNEQLTVRRIGQSDHTGFAAVHVADKRGRPIRSIFAQNSGRNVAKFSDFGRWPILIFIHRASRLRTLHAVQDLCGFDDAPEVS